MKKIIFLISLICFTTTSHSQINEVGIILGGSNYIGDVGSETYINPNSLMVGVLYKKNLNPRIAVRGTFTMSQLKADDVDSNNSYRNLRDINFKNNLKELAIGLEFNYFEYNLEDYRKSRTPYILIEIAAFNYSTIVDGNDSSNYEFDSKTSFSVPFGVGYKSKLFGDFAIAVEVRARYTFEDDLDYNNQDIQALNFGNPNNNDWYVFSGFSLVYSFGRPPCYSTPY